MSQALSLLPTLEKVVDSHYHGIIPAEHAILTREQRNLLERLDGFEAPYLQEKLDITGKFTDGDSYQEAFVEFKKISGLFGLGYKGLAMTSPKVDDVWHQFILFTPQYAGFCDTHLGSFLHHIPETSHTGLGNKKSDGVRKFVRAYSEVFGELSEIWNIKPNSFGLNGEGANCTIGCSGSSCSGSNCGGAMCGCNG
ncbi:MAG: hypothetical protein IH845_03795 [Nanoarchaeota archaeon]|nr:hypothetical protein [Nanoarchaeota archaeon]